MAVSPLDKITRRCGQTMFGPTSVRYVRLHDVGHARVLVVGTTYQSATYLDERWCEPVFRYHWLFEHLFDAWPEGDGPRSVAILGGGGYALPKHLVAHHPEVRRIDVVEIDPAIERIARRFFYLDRLEGRYHAERDGRLHLHVGDALGWLGACQQRFDVIINDCFLAQEPETTLMSTRAAQVFRAHLNPGGLYLSNVVSALEGPEADTLHRTSNALRHAFPHEWVYPCSPHAPKERDNNVLIASDTDRDFVGALRLGHDFVGAVCLPDAGCAPSLPS